MNAELVVLGLLAHICGGLIGGLVGWFGHSIYEHRRRKKYHAQFDRDIIEFIENFQGTVPADQMPEIMAHIVPLAINGMPNHIHIFVGYKPHQLIPDLLQAIKGCSSTWINEKGFIRGKFRWQAGYGAFSYSHSQIDSVVKYIMNQEQHHKKKTFREEYIELLQRF